MRVLITNDDGIRADGIRALWQAFSRLPEAQVTVVAPDRERSATGHAITTHRPILVDDHPTGLANVRAYSVGGTPADCVKLAVEALMPLRPDVCLSGLNRGANLGTDVFYSGTVSAAIEASLLGIPSIALSLDVPWRSERETPVVRYRGLAEFAALLAPQVLEHGLPPRTLLNVNARPGESGELGPVKVTRLGVRLYSEVFEERRDPRGRPYYWLAGKPIEVQNDPESDVVAVANGFVSVTPIHLDLTHPTLLSELTSWRFNERAPAGDPRQEDR